MSHSYRVLGAHGYQKPWVTYILYVEHGVMQGYGTLLMREAERIACVEHRSTKLAVISGVGTRHYYRKLGYYLEGHYMVKVLVPPPRRRTQPSSGEI